jgi:hypothetical protein
LTSLFPLAKAGLSSGSSAFANGAAALIDSAAAAVAILFTTRLTVYWCFQLVPGLCKSYAAHSCLGWRLKLANPFLWREEILGKVLGARPTGNSNLAGGHDQEFAMRKLVSVFLQHGIEVFDLGLKAGSGKSKEDDPGVEETFVEDQFAEISIGNEQNALLVRAIARTCSSARPGG